MAFELRGFLTGIALELSANPLFLDTSKKIVAYSYNGTVLPKLPEWDREMYPYAAMSCATYSTGTIYSLALSSSPWWYNANFNMFTSVHLTQGFTVSGSWWECTGDFSKWENVANYKDAKYGVLNFKIGDVGSWCWVNEDVYDSYEDGGALHVAASEPVPIYEQRR